MHTHTGSEPGADAGPTCEATLSLNIAYELENLPPQKAEKYRQAACRLTAILNAELSDSTLLTAVPFLVGAAVASSLAGGTFARGVLLAGRKMALTAMGEQRIGRCSAAAASVDQGFVL